MELDKQTYDELQAEVNELRLQLEEANDTIQAIRSGQVDAFVFKDGDNHRLYTLKTADQTYRVFIEKMNEGAITLNRQGMILYCNSRFAAMVNVQPGTVVGRNFKDFIPEGQQAYYNALISKGWKQDCKEEINLRNTTGKLIPCLLSCNVLELDDGVALSLILTDLTMQKNGEQELKVINEELVAAKHATEKLNDKLEDTVKERTSELLISREHLKVLANSIPQMTWTSLPNGEGNFYNQQWFRYTGLNKIPENEQGWEDIIHPDDIVTTLERYSTALKTGAAYQMENRYKGADGTYRWYLNRAIPLRNDAGEIILWVGTATDIEDQKKEIERKDEFIGIASHELKTPLTSVKGYLQLIASYKKEQLPPVVKTYINKAIISINKLQHLVNDLLDVSKIQAGRLEYSLTPVNLPLLISACIENAEHIYPSYTFENIVSDEYIVTGNAERLEQVLMNLINNAVKYSPVNKKVIIKTAVVDEKIRVSVTDFGIGLSTEQIQRIFERFYRVEDKKFMTSGLGMGLYISAEIIDGHKGKIGVESQPGKGSTFYFDLPLVSA